MNKDEVYNYAMEQVWLVFYGGEIGIKRNRNFLSKFYTLNTHLMLSPLGKRKRGR